MAEINLWLDDIRPAPIGWHWAKTVEEAKEYLASGNVVNASLDHDLGICDTCKQASGLSTPEEWLEAHAYQSMPHCEHAGTGYTLVCWMEETGNWPTKKPTVHSDNPAGRQRMQAAIDREWSRKPHAQT